MGRRIAYYRKLKQLTQVQLADTVCISSKYLSRIETGATHGASLEVYWRICEALEIKFEDITKEK